MQDVLDLLRQYREIDRPQRMSMTCRNVGQESGSKDKKHLWFFLVFMLITTTIYMVWSIHHFSVLKENVDVLVRDRADAKYKADLFFDAVRRNGNK